MGHCRPAARADAAEGAPVLTVAGAVLPVFAVILAGWALARGRGLGEGAVAALNAYVVWLALPALLFDFVAEADWAHLDQPRFAAVCAGTAFGTFALAMLAGRMVDPRRALSRRSLDALTAAYANTAYMGIPICTALFGAAGTAAAVIASLVTVCALFALAVLLVEVDRGRRPVGAGSRGRMLARVGGGVLRNPIVAAPVAGAAWAMAGVPLPAPAAATLRLLGGSATPVALATIGIFLARRRAGAVPARDLGLALGLKIAGQPLIALALLALLPLPRPWGAAALVLAALPTGTGPFMAAELYGEETALAARAVLIGTAASALTVSLAAWWAG